MINIKDSKRLQRLKTLEDCKGQGFFRVEKADDSHPTTGKIEDS